MVYSVSLDFYNGPLDLLLDLITQKKLEINDVSLSNVTKQYLDYIETNDLPAKELSDFLSVAAKLLHIKTKALLPYLFMDTDEDEASLEQQLKIYKVYWEASKKINSLYSGTYHLFAKTKATLLQDRIFSPPSTKQVAPNILMTIFFTIINGLEEIIDLPRTSIKKTVSLAQKIANLKAALRDATKLQFKKFVYSAESKTDVIVNFLAVLELIKQREIDIESGAQGDILIKKI